jgi:hypothetical protein
LKNRRFALLHQQCLSTFQKSRYPSLYPAALARAGQESGDGRRRGGAVGAAREAARERRVERARLSSDILDLVVSGYAYDTIADKLKLSVKTVRRATAGAIEKRRLDSGAHYVRLQVLRLTKAMRVVDLNLENGDLKAVEPMLKVMAQLDKYHAPSWAAPAPPPLALARPPLALARPPLALARPPLALAAPSVAETGTENGAQAVEIQ